MLNIENLHATIDGKPILNGIDLHVPTGEVHAIMGPNGSGKTTTIRMLLGLLLPTDGTATVLGQDIRRAGNDRDGGRVGQRELQCRALQRDVMCGADVFDAPHPVDDLGGRGGVVVLGRSLRAGGEWRRGRPRIVLHKHDWPILLPPRRDETEDVHLTIRIVPGSPIRRVIEALLDINDDQRRAPVPISHSHPRADMSAHLAPLAATRRSSATGYTVSGVPPADQTQR